MKRIFGVDFRLPKPGNPYTNMDFLIIHDGLKVLASLFGQNDPDGVEIPSPCHARTYLNHTETVLGFRL